MSMRRGFHGAPVNRLIISVPVPDVAAVDDLLHVQGSKHPARGCRSEFVRLAIAEKLARDKQELKARSPG